MTTPTTPPPACDALGAPTAREWARILAAETAHLPEAEALAAEARRHAAAGDWTTAASLWRRASFLVRHTPAGVRWWQESRYADHLAREATEDVAFDRPALRALLGLPADPDAR